MKRRQAIRTTITFVSLLLFPITLNFFSPYVSIDGAMNGILSGSLLLFLMMFATATYFGRAWCGWICPMAAVSDVGMRVNDKTVNVKVLKRIRYTIFTLWAGTLILFFVMAGGIKGINPLHLTENFISVDMPQKYVIYYGVLITFVLLTFWLGRRGACHSICWMSPFLVAGYHLGRLLKLPALRVASEPTKCIACNQCNKVCPMSIDVVQELKTTALMTSDCILCGACVDICPKKVLRYKGL